MTIEEAIKYFEAWAKCNYKPTKEAAEMAISALRAQSANDGQMKKALRDNGFETFGQLMEAYQQIRSEQKTPCDVCAYNPPSSCDGKPCCICPAVPIVDYKEAEIPMREGFECVKNVQVSKQLAPLLTPYRGCPRGAMGIMGDKSIVDHMHEAKDYILKGQDENFVCIPESWYELCVRALERLQEEKG